MSYSFKDYLRDRGEFVDDEEVFGRAPLTERVFREFKLGVFTMFVITLLLVTLFYDNEPRVPDTDVRAPEPPAKKSLYEQVIAFIRPEEKKAPVRPEVRERPEARTDRRQERPGARIERPAAPRRVVWRKYTVRRGDTLYSIARKVYRDGTKWKLILKANDDKLKKPEDLAEKMVLRIPVRNRS